MQRLFKLAVDERLLAYANSPFAYANTIISLGSLRKYVYDKYSDSLRFFATFIKIFLLAKLPLIHQLISI